MPQDEFDPYYSAFYVQPKPLETTGATILKHAPDIAKIIETELGIGADELRLRDGNDGVGIPGWDQPMLIHSNHNIGLPYDVGINRELLREIYVSHSYLYGEVRAALPAYEAASEASREEALRALLPEFHALVQPPVAQGVVSYSGVRGYHGLFFEDSGYPAPAGGYWLAAAQLATDLIYHAMDRLIDDANTLWYPFGPQLDSSTFLADAFFSQGPAAELGDPRLHFGERACGATMQDVKDFILGQHDAICLWDENHGSCGAPQAYKELIVRRPDPNHPMRNRLQYYQRKAGQDIAGNGGGATAFFGGGRVHVCGRTLKFALLLDYQWWFANQLYYHAKKQSPPSYWYMFVAAVCARAGLSNVVRLAGILLHEILHGQVSYHCHGPAGAPNHCCHDWTQNTFDAFFYAYLGLPMPRANVTEPGHNPEVHEYAWPDKARSRAYRHVWWNMNRRGSAGGDSKSNCSFGRFRTESIQCGLFGRRAVGRSLSHAVYYDELFCAGPADDAVIDFQFSSIGDEAPCYRIQPAPEVWLLAPPVLDVDGPIVYLDADQLDYISP